MPVQPFLKVPQSIGQHNCFGLKLPFFSFSFFVVISLFVCSVLFLVLFALKCNGW